MATISKSFDVKISIIRPYITKNISEDDFSKINQTTALQYETLKTTAPQGTLGESQLSDEEVGSYLTDSVKELDDIYDGFDDLTKQAERELNSIVFTYDVSLPENELMASAERALFGSATGVITFAKYKRVLALEQVLNREISEQMINAGGTINVAA